MAEIPQFLADVFDSLYIHWLKALNGIYTVVVFQDIILWNQIDTMGSSVFVDNRNFTDL